MAVELRKNADIQRELERDIRGTETGAEKIRRAAILDLSQDLLRKLNPQLSSERVKELFFSSGDVFDIPLEKMSETPRKKIPMDELEGGRSAISIAQFYFAEENRDLAVPTRAILATKNEERIPGEKALLYIDRSDRNSGEKTYEKHVEVKTGFRKKEKRTLELPDVFIGDYFGKSVKGVDNLILGGSIRFYTYNSDGQLTFQAEGRCAIMPSSEIEESLSLNVGGDIHQYGGSLKVHQISGHNYIQHGGEIDRPRNMIAGGKTKIALTGEYKHLGGKQPDPVYVEITDVHQQRVIDKEIQLYALENGLTKQDAAPQQEKKITGEELQKQFEDLYTPHKEVTRPEKDGSSTRIRSHIVRGPEDYANFISDALAANWEITDKTEIAGYSGRLIVTLTRNIGPTKI